MGKSLKERTAHGIFWGGFNTFTQQLVQLGFGIIMARILTPGDYGLYNDCQYTSGKRVFLYID